MRINSGMVFTTILTLIALAFQSTEALASDNLNYGSMAAYMSIPSLNNMAMSFIPLAAYYAVNN